jgi:hypothetical protein
MAGQFRLDGIADSLGNIYTGEEKHEGHEEYEGHEGNWFFRPS